MHTTVDLTAALRALRGLTAFLLLGSLLLELAGRLLEQEALWKVGAQSNSLGVVLGLAAWALGWLKSPYAGQLLWLTAMLFFGLARFLRGSAAVPPDLALLGLSAAGALLLMLSYWRKRRAVRSTREPSRADVQPPP